MYRHESLYQAIVEKKQLTVRHFMYNVNIALYTLNQKAFNNKIAIWSSHIAKSDLTRKIGHVSQCLTKQQVNLVIDEQ